MSIGLTTVVLFAVFGILLFLSCPISVSIIIASIVTAVSSLSWDQITFITMQKMNSGVESFSLLAIPLFILAGNIMNNGGIARRLVNFSKLFVGWIPGSLAQANIVGNMLFGALSGSSVAAASAMGGCIYPIQKDEGYDPAFATAVNIASAPTGLLIPPTSAFIVYSTVAGGVSISTLFMAGYIPGILMGVGSMVVAFIYAKKHKYPTSGKTPMKEAIKVTLDAIPSLLLIIIVIGGIVGGIFTATEGVRAEAHVGRRNAVGDAGLRRVHHRCGRGGVAVHHAERLPVLHAVVRGKDIDDVSQLAGSVSRKIRELREKILYEIAFIESALDDPEHISLDGYPERLLAALEPMVKQVERLLASCDDGRVMSEGIKTVILGKPNAGKSSLMNVLLGEERAIVTEIAGTTRDTLEEHIYLQGISLNVVDTAGIRDTEDIVEKIGVERAMKAAEDADLIIYVVDGSRALDENDKEIMEFIRGRRAIVLLNKTDLKLAVDKDELENACGHAVIPISAKEEQGIEALEEEIKRLFYHGKISFNEQVYITNVRHKEALEQTLDSLKMVKQSVSDGMPEDFYSIDLMNAYEQLGKILGEAVEDDLVNEIFSKFCMGK